jgi:hypothetical protein
MRLRRMQHSGTHCVAFFGTRGRQALGIHVVYRASHIRLISEFILYATKNTNDADHLIPFIM